jgi:hypothetical protein
MGKKFSAASAHNRLIQVGHIFSRSGVQDTVHSQSLDAEQRERSCRPAAGPCMTDLRIGGVPLPHFEHRPPVCRKVLIRARR